MSLSFIPNHGEWGICFRAGKKLKKKEKNNKKNTFLKKSLTKYAHASEQACRKSPGNVSRALRVKAAVYGRDVNQKRLHPPFIRDAPDDAASCDERGSTGFPPKRHHAVASLQRRASSPVFAATSCTGRN